MRDSWYADKRDLVKWGTLAHIAEREHLPLIVQVPYPRVTARPPLQSGNTEVPIHPSVWQFFRNLSAVEDLGAPLGREIVVIPDIFDPRQRQRYNQTVADTLSRLPAGKVVLLDPDTGLAPRKASGEHLTPDDVGAVWSVLHSGDWLVLYQHASRTKTWRADGRQRLEAICCVQECEEFSAPDISWDVVFFAVRKS
jgi:hypothetical protein